MTVFEGKGSYLGQVTGGVKYPVTFVPTSCSLASAAAAAAAVHYAIGCYGDVDANFSGRIASRASPRAALIFAR